MLCSMKNTFINNLLWLFLWALFPLLLTLLLWVRFHRASNPITCNQQAASRIPAARVSVFQMKFQVLMLIPIDQLLCHKSSNNNSNNTSYSWLNSTHKRILLTTITIMILVLTIRTLTKQTIIILILLLSPFRWFLQSTLSSRVSSAIFDSIIHLNQLRRLL